MSAADHSALRKLIQYAVEEAEKQKLDFTAYLLQQAAASVEPEDTLPKPCAGSGATLTDFGIKQNPGPGKIISTQKLQ